MIRRLLGSLLGIATIVCGLASPLAAAPCTPTTTPNTTGVTQNSILELLESICSNQSAGTAGTGIAPSGSASLAVGAASARVALPNTDSTIIVWNTGSTDAFFKLGNSAVTAATTDNYLGAGRGITLSIGANTHIAGITASGSTSFSITQGTGLPSITGGGGGGGSGGGSSFNTGFPSTGTAVGLSDGTNMVAWRATNNAAWVGGNIAAGASDSGNPVKMGAVYNSAVPTYTNGQRGDLQIDANGNLKVTGSGILPNTATAGQGGSVGMCNVTTLPTGAGGAGVFYYTNCDVNGGLRITQMAPTTTAMQAAAAANGNGTAVSVQGYATVLISVKCTVACSGGTTINFEGADQSTVASSTGNVGWQPLLAMPVGGGSGVTTATTDGQWIINVAGFSQVRARISGYSAGTVYANGSPIASSVTQSVMGLIGSTQAAIAAWGHGATGSSVPSGATYGGCAGRNVEQTAVTNGQLSGLNCDLQGRLVAVPYAVKEKWARGQTSNITDTTQTDIIAAGSGSDKNYVTDWECSNAGTTTVFATFNDTASTSVLLPAGSGNNKSLRIPIVTAAATAFKVTLSGSPGGNVKCGAQGYQGL